MAVHRGSVLLDANAIMEAHRVGCWAALAGRYTLETVDICFEETQTGFQRRRPEQNIDGTALRASLAAVHPVGLEELAEVDLRGGQALDRGERALWAHALTRDDAWVLCGPDKASMRFGFENGDRERLVSLENLVAAIGHRPAQPLRDNYRDAWLQTTISQFIFGVR